MINPFSIEPILRQLRSRAVVAHIPPGGVFVDIGCDSPPKLIEQVRNKMDFCIGIDTEIENKIYQNIELKKVFIKKKIPIESDLAMVVTMLAVLEHLDFPQAISDEIYRILKPGGILLLTVPAPRLKPILEVLAFFRIVRPEMIAQHKNYFTHNDLKEILYKAGFKQVQISSFQFGFNTFAKAIK